MKSSMQAGMRQAMATKRRRTVKGKDTLTLGAPEALALGEVRESLKLAGKLVFAVCADERRRQEARLSAVELDALFTAHHAIKVAIGLLDMRDPWEGEGK